MNTDEEDDPQLISDILEGMQEEEAKVGGGQPQQQHQQQVNQEQFVGNNQQPDGYDNYEPVEYEDEQGYYHEEVQKTMMEKIVQGLKMPLVVLTLFLMISFIRLDKLIYKILPAKLVSVKYINGMITIMVCFLYTSMYYGISKFV